MSQAPGVGELDESVGYALKQTATALRAAMDAVVRPLDLTTPQYVCLELLGRDPGQSNADLARAAFVTRQSMNEVLRGLQERGLLHRPAQPTRGRALPTELTSEGRRTLDRASRAVAAVERQMLTGLSPAEQRTLLRALASCREALG